MPHNLPIQLTIFIGLERAMVEVKRLLANFEERVWLVELGSLSDESLVPCAFISTRRISGESGRALIETLANELEPKTILGIRE